MTEFLPNSGAHATDPRSPAMSKADLANGEGNPSDVRCAVIAVDESDQAVNTARAALRLFGHDTRYVLVNVGVPEAIAWASDPTMWGTVPPAMVTIGGNTGVGAVPEPHALDDRVTRATQQAETTASTVAASAGLVDARPVGTTGDTADSICAVADDNHADVIVVGTHHRSWLSRLLSRSVTSDVLRTARCPVLVVPT